MKSSDRFRKRRLRVTSTTCARTIQASRWRSGSHVSSRRSTRPIEPARFGTDHSLPRAVSSTLGVLVPALGTVSGLLDDHGGWSCAHESPRRPPNRAPARTLCRATRNRPRSTRWLFGFGRGVALGCSTDHVGYYCLLSPRLQPTPLISEVPIECEACASAV